VGNDAPTSGTESTFRLMYRSRNKIPPEAPVRALFSTIEQDPRHEDISVIQSGLASDRVFSRWAMARVSVEGEPDIRLIAHTDGIARP